MYHRESAPLVKCMAWGKNDIDKKNNMITVIPDCQFDNTGLSNVYESWNILNWSMLRTCSAV